MLFIVVMMISLGLGVYLSLYLRLQYRARSLFESWKHTLSSVVTQRRRVAQLVVSLVERDCDSCWRQRFDRLQQDLTLLDACLQWKQSQFFRSAYDVSQMMAYLDHALHEVVLHIHTSTQEHADHREWYPHLEEILAATNAYAFALDQYYEEVRRYQEQRARILPLVLWRGFRDVSCLMQQGI